MGENRKLGVEEPIFATRSEEMGQLLLGFFQGGREKFILDLIIARLGWGFGRMGIIIGRIDLGCQLDS
jgi:hypothetical protein